MPAARIPPCPAAFCVHTARAPFPQKPFLPMPRVVDEIPPDDSESGATDNLPPQEEGTDAAAQDPTAGLKAEVEKWKDLALSTAAELDNFRKRSSRDMQDARAYANADLLRGLLPILDTFEMGLEAARAESEKASCSRA